MPILAECQPTTHALTLPHFITKEDKFRGGSRVGEGSLSNGPIPARGKRKRTTAKAEHSLLVHSLGRQVGGRGRRQRVSLPCSCVVCGRIGGKQENHELEKLFTPDYDRLKASAHFIKSSHLSPSLPDDRLHSAF